MSAALARPWIEDLPDGRTRVRRSVGTTEAARTLGISRRKLQTMLDAGALAEHAWRLHPRGHWRIDRTWLHGE